MAQRNPMNDRYQGDGPQGKTRKSATKLKPKAGAASTVHIEAKPTTKQERKAAQKRRKSQLEAKDRERLRKAKERERKQKEAAGEVIEEAKPPTILDKVKGIFINPDKKLSTKEEVEASRAKRAAEKGDGRGGAGPTVKDNMLPLQTVATWHRGPDTPEYRKLKYIYWALLGCGIVAAGFSLLFVYIFPDTMQGLNLYLPLGVSYAGIISALVLDTTKIKKIQRAHQYGGQTKKSPKQVKHAREQAEAAALLEQSKKAQKDQKRADSKIPFVKGMTKTKTKTKTDSSSGSAEEADLEAADAEDFEALEEADLEAIEEDGFETAEEDDSDNQ